LFRNTNKEEMKMDIHRAGRRPKKSGSEFYKTLLEQYETMTTRTLATYYHVSPGTISNWLKKARVSGLSVKTEQKKQEVHAANE
jgi:transposase